MAVIPNLPQALLDIHHHWHDPTAHPGAPGGRVHAFGTPGGGLEFLQFHRDFMQQIFAWYNVQPFGTAPFNVPPFTSLASAQAAVAPWTSLPPVIKNPTVTGWSSVQATQEARITSNSPPFASADDLGTYIEGGIHGWLHGAAAAAYGEPVVGTLHSPQSTYFYQIHGWVDYWWKQWQAGQKTLIKEIIDTKSHIKDFKELHKELIKEKDLVKEHKELIKEHKEFKEIEKPIKEKDKEKDIFEGGGFPGGPGDPGPMIQALTSRLSQLEMQVAIGRAFIKPDQRPDVAGRLMQDMAKV